jgi:hypothetical protein
MTGPSKLRRLLRVLTGLSLIAVAVFSAREALRSRTASLEARQQTRLDAITQAQREMRDAYLARAAALKKWHAQADEAVQKSLPISPSELNSLGVETEGLTLNSATAFARFDWVQERLNQLASGLMAHPKSATLRPQHWADLERRVLEARARFSTRVSEFNREADPGRAYPGFAAEAALEGERNP